MSAPERRIDDRYRLLDKIGEGGMSAIYAAEHVGTRRRVALKLLRVSEEQKLAEAVQRFHAEARAASAIGSEHIVEVLDVGVDGDDTPYMAMELLEGEDLAKRIAQGGPLPPRAALQIVAQAAAGVAAAHARGVVHRDIKPANLFLCRRDDGTIVVKVLDFGIAKVRRELVGTQNVGLTRAGSVLGTPMYMAPEQALGASDVDARADVWGLGAVLYTALAGQPPFHGLDTLGRLILAICSQPIALLQDRAPWVSPEVASLVHRTLRRAPSERFADAGAFREALLALCGGDDQIHADAIAPLSEAARAEPAERLSLDRESTPQLLSDAQIAELLAMPGSSEDSFVATETPLPATGSTTSTPGATPATKGQIAPRAPSDGTTSGATAPPDGEPFGETDLDMAAPSPSKTEPTATWKGLALAAAALVAVWLWSPWQADGPTTTPPAPAAATTGGSETTREVSAFVEVSPADARLWLDGVELTPRDGRVELTGQLGSVHRLRLAQGTRTTEAVVVLTVDGPRPATVRLAPTAPEVTNPSAASSTEATSEAAEPHARPAPRPSGQSGPAPAPRPASSAMAPASSATASVEASAAPPVPATASARVGFTDDFDP